MTLKEGARTTMKVCLGVKKGEHVLILADTTTETIGRALFDEALALGAEPMFMMMTPRSNHGEEPPGPIAQVMLEMDVIVAPTQFSLTHTHARKKANDRGARIATMPMINTPMMSKGGMTADFNDVRKMAKKMHKRLIKYRELDLTTELGTDLHLKLGRRKWVEDTGILHRKGDFGNLPAGEIFIAPVEGKADGRVVIDGAISGIGKVDKPVTIVVENGNAVKISGGRSARKLRDVLKKAEKNLTDHSLVYNIAEFGIGLNPNARIIGNPLEDEKVLRTVHIAVGDNLTFGGKVRAGIHLDGIITKPTVTAGTNRIMDQGEIK